MAQIDANGAVKYIHTDKQSSVIALSDTSGNVISRRNYGSYGETSATQMTDAAAHPFGYTGRRWDADLGIYYYRARWYDPEVGTFLETDPVGVMDYVNLYSYVGLDPLNLIDPTGRDSCGGGYVDGMGNWYGGSGSCPGYDYNPAAHPKTTAAVLASPIAAAASPVIAGWAIINAPQIAMFGELVITGYTPAGASVLTIGTVATKAGVNLTQMSNIIKAQGNELKTTTNIIAGANDVRGKPIGDISRLIRTYGGKISDWSKIKSSNTKFENSVSIETHAYRNNTSGQVVEPKIIIREPKGKQ